MRKHNCGLCLVMVCLAALLASSKGLQAEEAKKNSSTDSLKSAVIEACKKLGNEGIDDFVIALPGPETQVAELKKGTASLTTQHAKAVESFGRSLGKAELIREEWMGKSYYQLSVAEYFSNTMLVWRLIYYRGKDEWTLRHIHFELPGKSLKSEPLATSTIDPILARKSSEIAKLFAKDDVQGASELIQQDNLPAAKWKVDDIKRLSLNVQMDALNGNKPSGDYEWIRTERAGPRFVRFVYAIPRTNQAYFADLSWYKANDGWKIMHWAISNDTPSLFESRDVVQSAQNPGESTLK